MGTVFVPQTPSPLFCCVAVDQNWRYYFVYWFSRKFWFSFVTICNLSIQDFNGGNSNFFNLLSNGADWYDCFS